MEDSPRTEHHPVPPDENDLGPFPKLMRPFVDVVARARATVHVKLLVGFLTIAVLLLAMGVLSVTVLNRVDSQVEAMTTLHSQTDQARQMIYGITGQSHFRAMALVTEDPLWNDKIVVAKDEFSRNLTEIRSYSVPPRVEFFDGVAATDARFEQSSDQVTELFNDGELLAALDLHKEAEHDISHELEDALNVLIAESAKSVEAETESFKSSRQFLTIAVGAFSGVSLLAALLLGGVLSWSLIRPVRKVDPRSPT